MGGFLRQNKRSEETLQSQSGFIVSRSDIMLVAVDFSPRYRIKVAAVA